MGSFSNISLTVDKECGDNLLNPSDEDIIHGVGKITFENFCKRGYLDRSYERVGKNFNLDEKLNKFAILKELRYRLACLLGDVEEKNGDRCFTINEIKDGCVEEDIIYYILKKHGEKSYLEINESIDYGETETTGQYIGNAFSNGAEITLYAFNDENAVLTACAKLAKIYGKERIGDMLREACDEWLNDAPKL